MPPDDLSAFSRALRSILLDAGSTPCDGQDRKHCIRDYCACSDLLDLGTEAEMISISWAASAGTGPSHKSRIRMAISPDAIARSIAFAVEQPADVDVGKLLSAL